MQSSNKMHPVFGRGMSVHTPPDAKPNIVLGPDKAVFNENLINTKQRVGPNNGRSTLSKE